MPFAMHADNAPPGQAALYIMGCLGCIRYIAAAAAAQVPWEVTPAQKAGLPHARPQLGW